MSRFFKSTLAKSCLAAGGVAGSAIIYLDFIKPKHKPEIVSAYKPLKKDYPAPPTRSDLVKNIKETPQFDVLIIGGGAVGSGCAVDAATRGLNVCLLEKTDFGSGTSSKSTKMAHGGVRYLEKAIFQLSKAQLDLVIEALNERGNMLRTAPHLCSVLPIMIPVYNYWQVPYFFAGCKMYDWFAGKQNLRNSIILSKEQASAIAPMMDTTNLKAACVYHDGSFNDTRMNATLAITAIENGATVLNYFNVDQLLKDDKGKLYGVKATDLETKETYEIKATSVVNATGPFADKILEMDEDPQGLPAKTEQKPRMVVPSSGVHIVLPEYYCPTTMGLLDPSTADGRVMFFLPWQGKVLAGTTDTPLKQVPENPVPTEEDIQDIIKEMQKYLVFPIDRKDVLSAWSGIRPLVRDPDTVPKGQEDSGSTEGLVRSHLLKQSPSALVTISGGKWTTYREMAQETIDYVVKHFDFDGKNLKPCQTNELILIGGDDYSKNYSARLIHEYKIPLKLAKHLSHNYGSRSAMILDLYKASDYNKLPVTLAHQKEFIPNPTEVSPENQLSYQSFDEPFTIAELLYSLKYEYPRTPVDFLARRTRLAFLNAREAMSAVDGVVEIMSKELNWDADTTEKMRKDAKRYIGSMGISPKQFDVEKFQIQ
ncbi:mitochondrial glycerol-3-phosphate dehydrogenase [Lodderomyces elongisporus]|uniref:mitochondrial glycerol-3-phosphate dehydrogenase n=1 Tax=Lodderomyces elongisporus TaxID=36914 RepID=UPI0029272678|nr:mitochondrial glycerol-3-phosphate dehydrogenase [Lodderomyces elongisporus]WLF80707.1 mitochondrial glycerol-3-phosphate dehydrogenase [Lodderomyces elongisporus]